MAGGADLQVVKERLGHGSITTTEKYLHSLPSAHDPALNALDAVRGIRGAETDVPEGQVTGSESATVAPGATAAVAAIESRDVELAELRQMVAVLAQKLDGLT